MWFPAGNYMFKVNNKNTRTSCEICSKLTIKTPERWRSGVFIVNFEHVSHLVQLFSLLTLRRQMPAGLIKCQRFCRSATDDGNIINWEPSYENYQMLMVPTQDARLTNNFRKTILKRNQFGSIRNSSFNFSIVQNWNTSKVAIPNYSEEAVSRSHVLQKSCYENF